MSEKKRQKKDGVRKSGQKQEMQRAVTERKNATAPKSRTKVSKAPKSSGQR